MCETLLSTKLFDVQRRTQHLANGRVASRDVIVHPGAVVVLPLLPDRRVVMIRNHRVAAGRTLLELPAGTLEPGEKPADCAARELIEESGYRAATLEPMCSFFPSPGILSECMHAFVARDLTHVGQNLEETEEIEVQIIGLDSIRQMLTAGELSDGKTIAVLATYMLT